MRSIESWKHTYQYLDIAQGSRGDSIWLSNRFRADGWRSEMMVIEASDRREVRLDIVLQCKMTVYKPPGRQYSLAVVDTGTVCQGGTEIPVNQVAYVTETWYRT